MVKKNDEEFLKKLLATFRVEAHEHIEAMSSGLVDLEKMPAGEEQAGIVERIFREAHSLKGAARAVNFMEIESVCQALESVFGALKNKRIDPSQPLFDLLHQATDGLKTLLVSDAAGKPAMGPLTRRLDDAAKGATPARVEPSEPQEPRTPTPPSGSSGPATIRVHLSKLDSVMRQTEELMAPRLASRQRAAELREAAAAIAAWRKQRAAVHDAWGSIERLFRHTNGDHGDAKGPPELAKLLDHLGAETALLKSIEARVIKLERSARHDHRALAGMTDSLLHDVKEMYMLPFSSLLEGFPRLVRDLARDQDKEVKLIIHGGGIEIDRRILEEMKDPLMHLLRNSLDHGIEKPVVREQKRKPPHGTLTIAVSHKENSKVEIVIADDGAGIDVAKVAAAAGRAGLLSAGETDQLDERQVLALIFQSGLSTSPIITEVSGRGLGLAIVREKVDRLGGAISMENHTGAGTTVRIVLPVTLATFRGILVRAAGRRFIIPAVSVERVARIAAAGIRTAENRETIQLDGKTLSLVWLSDALELRHPDAASPGFIQVVVLGGAGERIAFRVDAVLAEHEILVKGLGRQLARVRNVAGASVLGTGEVVPVLNVPDLMRSALKTAAPHPAGVPPAQPSERRSILVAEDSITARTLLKNILEAAGYSVTTAVDGIDAYTALKSGTYDLIVSDVEMPRMDGFDLTARVRADKQLSDLPVVLVTALESREHRERGIDAGASAYLVKSSFDQSNLLEVVRRLIS